MSVSSSTPRVTSRAARAGVLAVTVVVAVAINLGIAGLALAAGAPTGYGPLNPLVFGAFTVIGITVGWFLWQRTARRVRHPERTMPLLAAVVLVVSFAPDLLLLATGFIPGTTLAAVVALMAMHVVTLASAVVGYTVAARR